MVSRVRASVLTQTSTLIGIPTSASGRAVDKVYWNAGADVSRRVIRQVKLPPTHVGGYFGPRSNLTGKTRAFLPFLLASLLVTTGCIHLSMDKSPRAAQPLPEANSPGFSGSRPPTVVRTNTVLEVQKKYTLRRFELDSHDPTTPRVIVVDYYQLPRSNSPVVMLLPISGGNYEPETLFARYFAKRGLAVALVHRREIGHETPTPQAINDWLKQNVADNKQVLDWLETRPELDAKRIGLFGISMGGIQAALLAGLDQRIEAAIAGLAGGDLPFILSHSTEKTIVRQRKAFMGEHGMTVEQFEDALRQNITMDPCLVAEHVDPKRTMLVLGMCDKVVPFHKGWELRRKMGRPETVLLPTGHYSAVLCIPYVERVCLNFLRDHLQGG